MQVGFDDLEIGRALLLISSGESPYELLDRTVLLPPFRALPVPFWQNPALWHKRRLTKIAAATLLYVLPFHALAVHFPQNAHIFVPKNI